MEINFAPIKLAALATFVVPKSIYPPCIELLRFTKIYSCHCCAMNNNVGAKLNKCFFYFASPSDISVFNSQRNEFKLLNILY